MKGKKYESKGIDLVDPDLRHSLTLRTPQVCWGRVRRSPPEGGVRLQRRC